MWSMQQTESEKYVYTFEGERNLLICSYSRYDEFLRLADELSFLSDFDVKCFSFIAHDQLIIADSEGFVATYKVLDYE